MKTDKRMILSPKKGRQFHFEGRNLVSEQLVRGEIVAQNEDDARRKLKRRGIRPLQITRIKQTRRRRITQTDIAVFTRQLSAMLKAGLPLLQAFDIVARGHNNPAMSQLLTGIRNDVEQGTSLSAALAKHPKYFNRLYCNLIQAGEAGGVLDTLLEKLALYQEKTMSMKKKVKAALTYPIAVMAMTAAVLTVMMVYVLPAFSQVYADMGAELPWFTQAVMGVSAWFADAFWWLLLLTAGGIAAAIYLHRRSVPLQTQTDALLLRLPVLGNIVQKSVIARWARTCATLFTAGVPLLDALESVAGAAGNRVYENASHAIRVQVNQGISLTSAMRSTHLFPNLLLQMTSIGEETGSLDDMLNKAAEFYEDDVDTALAQLSSLMTPIIVLILGGVIGLILIAMYLPLFEMGNVIG
ncbi:MAG: type II secretion system F family protein [Neisseria sp.]|nr:type II secretion system F family protein [Neisseria sp.]